MDKLKNKVFISYDYTSRYAGVPNYFDALVERDVAGIGTAMRTDTPFIWHKLLDTDTLDSLALKYYNNPTYWWIIAYFNKVKDPFTPLQTLYKTIKIPTLASVAFKD